MRTRNFVNFFFQKKQVPHPSTRIQIVDHKNLKIDCNQMVNDYGTNKSVNILCREKTTMQHSLNPNDQKVSSWFVKFALYFHYGPRAFGRSMRCSHSSWTFPWFQSIILIDIFHFIFRSCNVFHFHHFLMFPQQFDNLHTVLLSR